MRRLTQIRDFFFKEGLIRLDESPCNAFDPAAEITAARWAEFAGRAGIDTGLEPITVLENLHLLRDGRMTHAGAWLLTDDITRFTVQAGVTCAVFRGDGKTHILDRKEFTGNLYGIYQEVMAYFQAKLNSALISQRPGTGGAAGAARERAPRGGRQRDRASRLPQYRQRAGVHLPGPNGDRHTGRTPAQDARGGTRQQERSAKLTVRHEPGAPIAGTEWKRHKACPTPI